MSYITLDQSVLIYYFVNFIVMLGILAGFRWFANLVANASLHELLAEHDNGAVGISLAGGVMGIAIMLMGAVSGNAASSLQQEVMLVTAYGVLGIVLMWVTRQVFDYISLPKISITQQIHENNIAAGLVDAGNLIASAIIVRAVMTWVEGDAWINFLVVLLGFIASQIIMYLATLYRSIVITKRHAGRKLHEEIEAGNLALAIRFSGHRIGVALAVTSTSGLVVYDANNLLLILSLWFGIALVLFIAQSIISFVARMILLPSINVGAEVIEQRNVAVGTLEAAIFVAVGLAFVGLLG